ncbi:hypothetical protein GMB86_15280 [Terrilactibacillus sp. BCM23-1]|uniref:GNAT family N-acetyltransferase n=1 Tax=Terrilactibacillus tamarindi TaxID=2599694 RepID=A0A6N8CV81_9BACI|nr:hypothetical protein [Terrilactibacillus tamarindi]MTT33357.1 hypothetical protein [Terrilactibacillus tamarindi]
MAVNKDDFFISTNKDDLDIAKIYHFLHHEAYWSKGIPKTTLEDSIKHSTCFGVYEIAENTRDFSHEMNRLRIGRGLCHVNYPTYA